MDFSSVPRALTSLQRRQPALSEPVLAHVEQLQQVVNGDSGASSDPTVVLESIEGLLTAQDIHNDKVRWEPLAVGLYVGTQVLLEQQKEAATPSQQQQQVYMEGPRVPTESTDGASNSNQPLVTLSPDQQLSLGRLLHAMALQHLEHAEPRVRTLVAKAVGAHAPMDGLAEERAELHAQLVASIRRHLERGRDEAALVAEKKEEAAATEQSPDTTEQEESYSRSSTGALDDTTGWRALETNWLCLASLITAMGAQYFVEFPFDDEQQLLQDCQSSCVDHLNRHVRAAGMQVLEQWVTAAADSHLLSDGSSPLNQTCLAVLQTGLADNWSQVRMAASVLCRVYLLALQKIGVSISDTDIYQKLLPRMCLNRFYLAQGVKLYSHETWRLVFADSGLEQVAQHLGAVCRYYVKMCDADNHVVREAACQAIAELAYRLGEHDQYKPKLQPLVDLLLQALLMCFHDESWPVRDEACLATATLCKAFPEDCRPELNTLWDCWTSQLTDQIWSVREDAAVALGDALQAYGVEFLDKLRQLVDKLLPSAREQPAMTPSEYRARQNDIQAHTNSQLYSCGSLAPKLRKGGAGRIGCSSCDVNREKSPWEATDGCIYLIRELVLICSPEDSPTPMSDDELVKMLTELADVCRVRHFPQSDDLRATLWRNLPAMAQALGKNRFKRLYLEIFMDLLFTNLESRSASQLSVHAAGQCCEELANLVGKSIFRARLEEYQREIFDNVLREREMMPKGPADAGQFSPFGPPGLLDSVGTNGGGGALHPGIAGPGAVRPHV